MSGPQENSSVGDDVLLVDDTPANLKLLAEMLSRSGYRVRQATSGQLALRCVQARVPAIILLDIRMPDMDGYEVCRRLKLDETTRAIPVIFITMLSDSQDKVRGFDAGGVDFICKPFDEKEVLARVQTHLVLRHLQQDVELRNAELKAANERLTSEIEERRRAEQALRLARDELETRVCERTAELARTNEVLRESEAKYRRLHESMNDAFVSVEMSGRILDSNQAYRHMLGYTAVELAQLSYLDLTPEKWHATETRIVQEQILKQGFSDVYEKEYRRKDGTVFPVELRTFLLTDDQGKPVAMWAIVRDLSERKRLEVQKADLADQLRQSQKLRAIAQLAGGVAHNFNNLLQVVSGNADIIADTVTHPSTDGMAMCQESVTQLQQAVETGRILTRRLLAFSRQHESHPTSIDPQETIAGMLDTLRAVLGSQIRLQMESGAGGGTIRTNPTQVEESLLNLAMNARDAMPEGGTLTIRTTRKVIEESVAKARGVGLGPYVCISVSDTGAGMDKETRKRLFEPFFTTKPLGQGVGLGLAMVYGFVAQSGGFIDVESQPGRGTTFTLFLPEVSAGKTPAPVDHIIPGPMAAGETVLFCEDDPMIRPMIAKYLTGRGYSVIEAQDAEAALEIVDRQKRPVDLLVTDIHLTFMNGVDLAREMKQRYPSMKYVFISGHPDYVPDDKGALGPDAVFLCKPLKLSDLLNAVQGLIRKA
jgi:two-component system, cell cycle sensor histidine kinase and response regulator CckA